MSAAPLAGVRVLELADTSAEYAGLLLAGLGADVIKIEPPGGSATRRIGPFFEDRPGPERSLFFWNYNRLKRSVVLDLETADGIDTMRQLTALSDVFLDATPRTYLDSVGLGRDSLRAQFPALIIARMSPFGDVGPWRDYQASDLIHLALGGPMMNCGYSPRPDGSYDLPPIAPQLWHSYHIAGEQLVMMTLAALLYRGQRGVGQLVCCAVHEAVSKNTELDVMNWVMRRTPVLRQTCTHAMPETSMGTPLAHTKDGRWFVTMLINPKDYGNLVAFLDRYGMAGDLPPHAPVVGSGARAIPGSTAGPAMLAHAQEVLQRFVRRFTYAEMPWREMQDAGIICVPLRKPEENVADEHWHRRGTFSEIHHPEHDRSFTYVTSKWLSSETEWVAGRRAPLLDEDRTEVLQLLRTTAPKAVAARRTWHGSRTSRRGRPMALDGIRVLDFTWFLASAGGTRFLAALGAECIKVEWAAHPDTRLGVMAPVGGREARRTARAPLPGVNDPDMGGQFNNKNAGKRGISLNVRHPQGLAIARQLVGLSDIVAEGFSPGVMDSWGLGWPTLQSLKPDIIYAQQSGMGGFGSYGRFRALGPVAAALAGTAEMSGLAEPAMPAGWGYSYLDWIGAYSFAVAMLSALTYRDRTGRGQHIDASQTETGIFIAGPPILDASANERSWRRFGNRSPYQPAAPHGAYRCAGTDRWLAIACFDETAWQALARLAGRADWLEDPRFATLADRLLHQDELDAAVTEWTQNQGGYELMHALQGAGVAAGVCQDAADRVDDDPQLAALEWLTEVTGTKIGTWPVAETPVKLSETPTHIGGPTDRGAPCYGEDNEYVLGDLLGYTTGQIKQFAEDHVI